jgi:hypothetical protein
MNLKEMVEKINPDVDKYVNDIFDTVEEAIKNFDWEVISKDSFMWRGIFAYGLKVSETVEIAEHSNDYRRYVYITEWAFKELILSEKLCSIPYDEVKACLPLMVKKGIIADVNMNHDTGLLYIGIWLE